MKTFLDNVGYFGWGVLIGYFLNPLIHALKSLWRNAKQAHQEWDKSGRN